MSEETNSAPLGTSTSQLNLQALSNEFVQRRQQIQQNETATGLQLRDFLALVVIDKCRPEEADPEDRIYLRDVSQILGLTSRNTAAIIGALRDKGLVTWKHDGDGSEGTYAVITDEGRTLMATRKSISEDYFSRVIARFGEDNMAQLLDLMKQLGVIMKEEGSASHE